MLLQCFIRWTVCGFKDLHGKRNMEVDNITRNICNTILYHVKTDCQVSYKSVDDQVAKFRYTYENAQVVGLGLTAQQFGRKNGLVNLLHHKGDAISNERCLAIETSIANEVIKTIVERGFYLPPNAKPSRIVQFHLDNCNILEDGDDGRNITNSLLLVGMQYCNDNNHTPYLIPRSNNKTLIPNNFQSLQECAPPLSKDFKCSDSWKYFKYYENEREFVDTLQCCMKPWLMIKSLETGISKILSNMSQKMYYIEEDKVLIECIGQEQRIASEAINPQSTSNDNINVEGSDNLELQICSTSNTINEELEILENINEPSMISLKAVNLHIPLNNNTYMDQCDSNHHDSRRYFTTDTVSAMSSAIAALDNLQIPPYSAYNSILQYGSGNYQQVANMLIFPLIPGPANNYSAIYTGFKLAQNVTTHLCDEKTIITLDLDLYERTLKLCNSQP